MIAIVQSILIVEKSKMICFLLNAINFELIQKD